MYISSAVKDINDIHLKTSNIQSIAIFFILGVTQFIPNVNVERDTILMWDAQNILVVRKLAIESDCSPHCGDMLSLVAHSYQNEKNH